MDDDYYIDKIIQDVIYKEDLKTEIKKSEISKEALELLRENDDGLRDSDNVEDDFFNSEPKLIKDDD